ncbi:hypothetical protein H310_04738 [Aphanomyces invadans]|uniref:Uncharacterized protein n=1 Tax=Aphanomyces invadans TaxID=157072 RepID=A0A024UDY4_9STRA|nr:hypothetical protein H310_04738 [Aphanomyces invadans]ETW04464.1 hypothetical protein H310_04738 [Aphanomyces invadans]|eukprot:XP_008867420.1 hypothetical protein H310_04738 [Aphanomyces invadans]
MVTWSIAEDHAAACSDDQANHVDNAALRLQGPSLIMDSGASSHMTGDLSLLHNTKGELRIQSNTTGKTAVFQDTLHVPTLLKSLLSISQLARSNPRAQVVFYDNAMDIVVGPDVSIQAVTNETYATFVHRLQECVRKLFGAGDMTPEADRIFDAKVDSILEHIAKNDPEYCSLIGVIKSVEIVAYRMAHTSKTKARAPKVRGTDQVYHTEAGDKFCEWKGHDLSECRNKERDEANASQRQKRRGNPWCGGNMPVVVVADMVAAVAAIKLTTYAHTYSDYEQDGHYAHTYDRYEQDDLFTIEEATCITYVDTVEPF